MAGPCPEPHLLEAFATGRSPDEVRPAIEGHLDGCPACAETVATCARLFGSMPPTVATPFALTVGADTPGVVRPAQVMGVQAARGARAGRYVLGQRLGEGGMGVVFFAHDPELARPVAVKLLHPGLAAEGDPSRARLMREAQAMARLAHPNVVAVYDVGTIGEQLFIAMELVEGMTLRAWLATPRSREVILRVLCEAGRGLAAAHDAGLVHRDFKPDNVLVGRDGRARVTDFGVARDATFAAGAPAVGHAVAAPHVHAPTERGAIVGTPAYMAPEQLLGRTVDARCDQFAFGVTVFEAYFGFRPFAGETFGELMANVVAGRMIETPKSTPGWLRAWLARVLAPNPNARYRDMHEVLRELGKDHGRARRYALTASAIVGGAAVLVGGMHLFTRQAAGPARAPLPDPACDAEAVHAVWNDTRAGEVKAALDDAWSSAIVTRQLAAYATAWEHEQKAVCRGAAPQAMRDARLACLHRALGKLETTVGMVARPEADKAAATQLAFSLPAINACTGETTDRADPEPQDPALAVEVREIRRGLVEARALRESGELDAAKKLVGKLQSRANVSRFLPVVAEAELEKARWERVVQGGLSAAVTFEMAANRARECEHDRVVREATIDLVETIGVGRQEPIEAKTFEKLAEAETRRAPWDLGAAARLARNVAAVALVAGEFEPAEAAAAKAVRLEKELHPEPHPRRVEALLTRAGAQRELGDLEAAVATSVEALQDAQELFDDRGTLVVDAYRGLASALSGLGIVRAREAITYAEKARAIEALGRRDDARRIAILATLAEAHLAAGDPARAVGVLDEALEIAAAARLWKMRPAIRLHRMRGEALLAQGDRAGALRAFDAALASSETAVGPDHIDAGTVYFVRCKVFLEGKDLARAESDCAEAVAFFEAANVWGIHRAHDDTWSLVLVTQAKVALARGDRAAAREAIDRFLSAVEVASRPAHPRTGEALAGAGEVLEALGDRDKADEMFGRAARIFTQRFGADDPRTTAAAARVRAR